MHWPLPDGEIDLDAGEIRRGGAVSPLGPVEVRLLRYLADRPGVAVPVDELLVEVWAYHPNTRTRAVYFGVRKLRERLERDPSAPTVLVGTERRGFRLVREGAPPLAAVVDRPCGDDAALAVVAGVQAGLDPDRQRAIVALGWGVPDVVRLLAGLARALPLPTLAALLDGDPGALDPRLADAVDQALRGLPEPHRIGLEALAGAGPGATVPTDAALAAVGAAPLAALVERGFVRRDEAGYRVLPWVGARTRALEDGLRGTVRLADALRGPPAAGALRGVVERLAAAGHPLAGPACVRLLRAAHHAGVDPAVHAVALRLADDPVVRWWTALVVDVGALGRHEVLPHVEAAFPAAADRLRGDELAEAWTYLARFRREHGAVEAAEAALDQARRHASLPGRIDLELAYLRRASGDLAGADRPAELALRLLHGTPIAFVALGAWCVLRVDQGLPEEAIGRLDRALAEPDGTERARAMLRYRRAAALRAAERLDEASAELAAVEPQFVRLGDGTAVETCRVLRVLVHLDADRPADAAQACIDALAEGTPSSDLADSLRVLFELATLRATGRSTGADLARWAEALAPDLPVPDRLELSAWHAEILARRGERDRACALAEAALAEADRAGFHPRSPVHRALARALRAAQLAGSTGTSGA